MTLKHLTPAPVWKYFEEICQVPRPSQKEEKIGAYLISFAQKHALEAKRDNAGNILIKKVATKGKEHLPVVVLQSHMDMVCEKNAETLHDFDKDPIQPYIDGEWVKARGTTLGADDGIGMGAQLALLASENIEHGPLECLFTVDEESGLTGAFALDAGFFDGKILLNLDSEDEGEIFIGCAGGIDTTIDLLVKRIPAPDGTFALRIAVKGLSGGHSGDDINKGRGNAIKILTRFLWDMAGKYEITLADIKGGNLRNAIAREAYALILLPAKYKELLRVDFNIYQAEMEHVWQSAEPGLTLELESANVPQSGLDRASTRRLLDALYACPHGVFSMSYRMPGMVETSTNLASVKFESDDNIQIVTSQRSDVDSEKWNIAHMVGAVFAMADAKVIHGNGYPGWAPNPDSALLKVAVETYKKRFGKEPIVRSIHAGLECGLFLEKYPGVDMISFGPTLRGVHSPDEKVNIATVGMWWEHLLDILERIGQEK